MNIKNFEKNLYIKKYTDPDFLIRTGGHKRLVISCFGNLLTQNYFF